MLFDVDGRRGRWQPPHARRIALLAQDALLFPNLSVLDNVAFGPRAARVSPAAIDTARRWLREVAADDLADRKPGQLSGGQAQRVAVARAVAADPRLLLLDEPLAALDVTAAPLLRRVLRDVFVDRSGIVVTHDLLDAVLLSDRVVVLDGGRIVESGPTAAVLQHPTSPFTARLAGLNLIAGTALADGLRPERGGPAVGGIPRTPLRPASTRPRSSPRRRCRSSSPIRTAVRATCSRSRSPSWSRVVTRPGCEGDHAGQLSHRRHHHRSVGELDLYPGRSASTR